MALSPDDWAAIRTQWECDPDEPTFEEAAKRAAIRYGFNPPSRQAIHVKSKRQGWERRNSMAGIVAAAQRKADTQTPPPPPPPPEEPDAPQGNIEARLHLSAREDAEDMRAAVLVRHRKEWQQIVMLRQEAIAARKENLPLAFDRGRLAKILAETTAIQQAGERRAWGLDELPVDPKELRSKSDADLLAIVSGHGKLAR